jgi:hypothetical protein
VLWKQESFGVLPPLQIEFFRSLLGGLLKPTYRFDPHALRPQ